MNKIKVLHVIGSSNIGGGEKLLCDLIEKMDKEKFEVFIVCPPKGNMIESYKHCAKEIKLLRVNKIFNVFALFNLYVYIKNRKFDIVHTHLYVSDLFGIIASMFAGTPVIISTIHGHNFNRVGSTGPRAIKNAIFSLFYRAIYIFNDTVVAVCESVKKDLTERKGIKVMPEKVRVIYNAIDLAKIKYNDKNIGIRKMLAKEISGDASLIGMIANFDTVKGHRNLIKAAPKVIQRFPNVKFLLVGGGKEREFIKKMAKKYGISDYLIFAGQKDDILSLISVCDLIVLPSLSEGFSLVIMEAMALARPIVASNVGGIAEIIEDGKTGILVPSDNYDMLSNAIIDVLEDGPKAFKIGEKAREKIINDNRFHIEHMASQTEELYSDLFISNR